MLDFQSFKANFKKILLLVIPFSGIMFSQQELYIPPTIESSTINLTLQEGTTEFYPGIVSNTMGANGSLLGPTLILHKGENVSINVANNLNDTSTIHWHGLHVSPENDGGPHTFIPPGTVWNPQFTVLDRAGIFWYHPHLHMRTNEHVSKGIAGMIIVKDDEEAALNLPRTYGVDDFPIVIQTKAFDASWQIIWTTELDTSLIVNGTIDPFLNAPAQVIRLRVLNGSSQRVYKIGFTNDMPFKVIGTDGSLLTAPASLNRYQLAPGMRADILVDLSGMEGQAIQLINNGTEIANAVYGSDQPGMNPAFTLPGYNSNPLNGTDFVLLDINVGAQTTSPITSIPTSLVVHDVFAEGTEDTTRALMFTSQQNIVGPFMIDMAHFDMEVINHTIPLGNREIWTLTNQTPIAHPFHIHDVQFYILDINGVPPAPELRGLNDVVLVPAGMGTVRFITEFNDFANDSVPYMYHCHMLTHEDGGMMGQFIVTNPNLATEKIESELFQIYPNPALNGEIKLELNSYSGEISLVDIFGRLIFKRNVNNESVVITNLKSGIYFLRDRTGESKRIVVMN
ncbi:MAG: multicopper oxidase domain-containing protein [Flavobacteriia bacterium]|jgi:blue copper oxidase